MLTDNQVKEQLSIAYVHAVAASCNFGCELMRVDMDSVDAIITCNGNLAPDSTIRSPEIKLQLKATETLNKNAGSTDFSYIVKKKNYDDLRAVTLAPRLLVVLHLPTVRANWLSHSINDLIIRNCAYWVSLLGAADVVADSPTIYIPSTNMFSPTTLKDLMLKVSREQTL